MKTPERTPAEPGNSVRNAFRRAAVLTLLVSAAWALGPAHAQQAAKYS